MDGGLMKSMGYMIGRENRNTPLYFGSGLTITKHEKMLGMPIFLYKKI